MPTQTKKQLQQTNLFLKLGITATILLNLIFIIYITFSQQKTTTPAKAIPTKKPIPTVTNEQKLRSKQLTAFLTSFSERYAEKMPDIDPNNVTQAFPLPNNKIPGPGASWVIEVQEAPNKLTHYLLMPELQTELSNASSCGSSDEPQPLPIQQVLTYGNEDSLQRSLTTDPIGYLVITGQEEYCYASTGHYISVYKMSTGQKVKLTGNFNLYASLKGTLPNGNATGRLRGVYGINNPTIVVEYDGNNPYSNGIEALSKIAFFDPQTGRLKQLINFN